MAEWACERPFVTPADDVESVGAGISISTWGGALAQIPTPSGSDDQGTYQLTPSGDGYVYVQVTAPAGTTVSVSWDGGAYTSLDAAEGVRVDPSRGYEKLTFRLVTQDDGAMIIEHYTIML